MLVAGYGWLRWGELVGLRRRHVDLATTRVTVAEQVAEVLGRYIVGPPKTAAGRRVVTLPTVALDAGLAFPDTRGGYLERANFNPARLAAGAGSGRDHRAALP